MSDIFNRLQRSSGNVWNAGLASSTPGEGLIQLTGTGEGENNPPVYVPTEANQILSDPQYNPDISGSPFGRAHIQGGSNWTEVGRPFVQNFGSAIVAGPTSGVIKAGSGITQGNNSPGMRDPNADSHSYTDLVGGGMPTYGTNMPNYNTGGYSGLPGDVLGVLGSANQANAYQNQAEWAKGIGDPYRNLLSQSYANPMGYLSSPEVTGAVQQGTDALSRSLSMGGNPIGSGGALQKIQDYATNQQLDRLGQYRSQLGGFGGLNAINASIPTSAAAAIGARGNIWNAGGVLANDIFKPGGVASSVGSLFNNGIPRLPSPPPNFQGGQYGSGVDQYGNPIQGNFGGGTGVQDGTGFNDYSGGYDFGGASNFDPNIDWSNLYG